MQGGNDMPLLLSEVISYTGISTASGFVCFLLLRVRRVHKGSVCRLGKRAPNSSKSPEPLLETADKIFSHLLKHASMFVEWANPLSGPTHKIWCSQMNKHMKLPYSELCYGPSSSVSLVRTCSSSKGRQVKKG